MEHRTTFLALFQPHWTGTGKRWNICGPWYLFSVRASLPEGCQGGLKACDMKAWAEASMASRGPGNRLHKISLRPERPKQNTGIRQHSNPMSRPFRAERILFANSPPGLRALRFA